MSTTETSLKSVQQTIIPIAILRQSLLATLAQNHPFVLEPLITSFEEITTEFFEATTDGGIITFSFAEFEQLERRYIETVWSTALRVKPEYRETAAYPMMSVSQVTEHFTARLCEDIHAAFMRARLKSS
ncbi:MAG: hypothetical protein ACRENG_11125, partial [bacterium]